MITLVTGGTGHIGQNLVRALRQQGRRVRVLIERGGYSVALSDVEQVDGDVLDVRSIRRAVEGVEVVYHLAGRVSIHRRDAARVAQINTLGPRNIAAACLDAGVKRLVHFSSIHALSHLPVDGVVDETRPLTTDADGAPPYDRSKAAGEREILAAVARGLDAVIVNPTGVIGPLDYRPSATGVALLKLRQGALPVTNGGGFNFVDARDVAAGAIAAEAKGRAGQRYLLAGRWASMPELARIVHSLGGAPAPRFAWPLWLANAVAPCIEAAADALGREATFTRAAVKALSSHRFISTERAQKELGYLPRPLEQTIADTLAWFDASALGRGRAA